MTDSETFGAEKGKAKELVSWMNNQAKDKGMNFEARLYDYDVTTKNFGTFEMFSWMGDVQTARKLLTKASKRFKVKVIEGGYKPNERVLKIRKSDFAMVRKGDRVIGHLEFEASLIRNEKWKIKNEERR